MANTLDTLMADIVTLNATATALNARVHPTGQWTVVSPLSLNTSKVLYGLQIHNWGGAVVNRLVGLGAKRVHGVIALNGDWTIPDSYVNEAASLGVESVMTLLDTSYGTGSGSWMGSAAARWRGKCNQFCIGNEPWANSPSPAQYLAHLKSAYTAIKAANPAALVLAPSGTGNDFSWVNAFMALNPWPWLDAWSWHTYYLSPEESYTVSLNVVPRLVKASAGKAVPMYAEEIGWWGPVATDSTVVGQPAYTEATCTNYGSRYPFLTAASQDVRGLCIYAAKDEGQQLWGVTTDSWVEKPIASSLRDAFAHIHAATAFGLYARGNITTTATWFCRMDTATGQRLALGRRTGTVIEKVWVIAAAAGTLKVQLMGPGTQPASIPLVSGAQQVSVNAGQRAVVLSAPGARFPEFS